MEFEKTTLKAHSLQPDSPRRTVKRGVRLNYMVGK